MKLKDLIKANKAFNDINSKMVTNVIDSGITLVYGISGVGKTVSTIKNLNRYNIIPVLLDFDNNDRINKEVDCNRIDGAFFLENYDKSLELNEYNKNKEEVEQNLKNTIKAFCNLDMQFGENIYNQNTKCFLDMFNFALDKDLLNANQIKLCEDIEFGEVPKVEIIKNEMIIIDTYKKSIFHFDNDIIRYKAFLKVLLDNGNNIIIVAHSTGERGQRIDMDEEFANHCACRLHLVRSQTRTKEDSYCLFLEKIRGYNGDRKILSWER